MKEREAKKCIKLGNAGREDIEEEEEEEGMNDMYALDRMDV